MLGAGTEFVQLFIEGRSGCVDDFLVDCLGGMLGIIIWGMVQIQKLNLSKK